MGSLAREDLSINSDLCQVEILSILIILPVICLYELLELSKEAYLDARKRT